MKNRLIAKRWGVKYVAVPVAPVVNIHAPGISKDALVQFARERGIRGFSRMTKAQLVEALS